MSNLYRSQTDKKLTGLCGGLAEYLNVDSNLLRIILIITAVFTSGTVILLYFLISMVISKQPAMQASFQDSGSTYSSSNVQSKTSDATTTTFDSGSKIDDMMKDIEKKAMQQEIEDLKAKLAKYEKGEQK
ncbi:PspC domain-containing protein [Chengkuizengella axinellae]|uniref:PspC domain-containing protein n=1 Tax=Chengkuizengella axinellae TaxID=3064388 RepID=A0ABT9IT25_9BACL|nr:PspC domain-containing protein [Chengkuizengella sp. 2205SS18-9]MDP5272511.1 PspC domain-containing protein [Chengkuizengella sp. 2205SS18-9]